MTAAVPQQDGVFGTEELNSSIGEFNEFSFLVTSLMSAINVATLVQVKAVDPTNQTVDVLPLVNQVTGAGQAIPHVTVFGVPYFRLQAGANALICDPAVGDIGLAVICDRDITSAQNTSAQANPGSLRRWSFADSFYVGGWNHRTAVSRYLKLTDTGIEANTPVNLVGGAVYKVAGNQVVGARQAAITPPTGGGTIDAQARTAISSIITTLQTHGLTS